LRSAAIKIHGLICKGCGFNFEHFYGAIGSGFIEVHHSKPISQFGGEIKVDPALDLTVLCSNCHSIVHRKIGQPLALAELIATIQVRSTI
jgi:5-methylcytosine-specific restriction protein A